MLRLLRLRCSLSLFLLLITPLKFLGYMYPLGHGITRNRTYSNSHQITSLDKLLFSLSTRIKQLDLHSTPFDTTRSSSFTQTMSSIG